MNRRMIVLVLSKILVAEGIFMLPSFIVGLIYKEPAATSFLLPMICAVACGLMIGLIKPYTTTIYARDGFVIVALSWIVMSLVGAVPFYISGCFESVWDCIFEIVSGFTTTGASILKNIDALPHCILFWRSFSHWVGGMGVLVFILAIMPLSGERSLHIMRAEVPGPEVGKLVPRIRDTAIILYAVYSVMTAALIILLICGGMPVFDAFCYAFGTAGTGGFGTTNAGVGLYGSVYIEMVLSLFMVLFGLNFNLYYIILKGGWRDALRSEELHWFLAIIVAATAICTAITYSVYGSVGQALRYSIFQVTSIISSTGFSTTNFTALWPQLALTVLLLLMFIGACAGSTGGGLKVSRVIVLVKSFTQEIRRLIHPRAVTVVRLEGKAIDYSLMSGTLVYFAGYMVLILGSTLFLSIDGFDLTTTFSSVVTCINNIGPGLGRVGPADNFSIYSPFSKMLLAFNMLLGRLEIYPMLILFSPRVWRKQG